VDLNPFRKQQLWKRKFAARDFGRAAPRKVFSTRQTDRRSSFAATPRNPRFEKMFPALKKYSWRCLYPSSQQRAPRPHRQ
jgi:hypothetical protein